ncbi:hypothetical protein HK098_004748 [Nowakowskiella sp. JEL0407]|nr:hypothetical protein HK098_004748 [Nowakowskiella sp. JEL0407]
MSPLALMQNVKIKDWKANERRPLVFAENVDKLPDVLAKLVNNRILSMPVYHYNTKEYLGMIDMIDISKVIADLHWKCIAQSKSYREADIYVTYNDMTVQDVLDKNTESHHVTPGAKDDLNGPGLKVYDEADLATVARIFAKTGHRRVPILVRNKDGVSQVSHLITQSEIVRFLYSNISQLESRYLLRKIGNMAHFKQQNQTQNDSENGIIMVNAIAKAIEAFRVIVERKVSAVPIVDANQKLIATISVRDIRSISHDASQIKLLYENDCLQFSKIIRNREDNLALTPAVTCSLDDTMEDVLVRLNESKIHRVWIVDNTKKLVGVVALRDILAELSS